MTAGWSERLCSVKERRCDGNMMMDVQQNVVSHDSPKGTLHHPPPNARCCPLHTTCLRTHFNITNFAITAHSLQPTASSLTTSSAATSAALHYCRAAITVRPSDDMWTEIGLLLLPNVLVSPRLPPLTSPLTCPHTLSRAPLTHSPPFILCLSLCLITMTVRDSLPVA